MISNWNSVVQHNDIVYHLGDFALGKTRQTVDILKRLSGRIFLCIGSHDRISMHPECRKYFAAAEHNMSYRQHNYDIFLAHHCHKVWPKSHYGTWHLFGHSHGGMDKYAENEGKILDVGVDGHDFIPWHLDEITEVMKGRPLNFNDLKRRVK